MECSSRPFSKAAANHHFKGVAGMIPTARVQRGPSEAARCASTGTVPATPAHFQHPVLVEVGEPIVEVQHIQGQASTEGWTVILLVDKVVPRFKGHG